MSVSKITSLSISSISKIYGIELSKLSSIYGQNISITPVWLDGWDYRKSITLSRASGAVTNYQMKVLVGESSGATGEDVDCGGKCKTDFSDLRFTTSDKTTLLDYWIESVSGTTPNQLATIWIEFDSIGTGDTTFYMYYGNSGASAYSNGVNTFQLFDSFAGDSLDTDLWALNNDPTISFSGGKILISANASDHYVKSKTFTATNAQSAIRIKITINDSSNHATPGFGFGNYYGGGSHKKFVGQVVYSTASELYALAASVTNATFGDRDTQDYADHIVDVLWGASDLTQLFWDGVQVSSNVASNIPTEALPVTFGIYYANTSYVLSADVDWILVRQYLATEPAWGSWGTEETN